MKKRILLLCIVILSTFLTSCSKEDEKLVVEKGLPEASIQKKQDNLSYVLDTFATNNKSISKEDFTIKYAGQKRIVIIKEPQKNTRPNISKFIYIENEEDYQPIFLMIDNHVFFGEDQE